MKTLIGSTDIGLMRGSNQDRYQLERLSDTLAYAVLCDGMGGENGGGVASDIAVRHVSDALSRDLAEELSETTLRGILVSAITGANALVYEAAQKDGDLAGMGTTMIAAVFSGGAMYVAYVGDSRVYIVSPEQETQVTHDHTVVQMLVDIGEISEEDALRHPKRHFITRAVGVSPHIDVDFTVQSIGPEDIVLICSDGLYNYLVPGEFYPLLRRCANEDTVQPLIDLALQSGGSDNVTVIVAK